MLKLKNGINRKYKFCAVIALTTMILISNFVLLGNSEWAKDNKYFSKDKTKYENIENSSQFNDEKIKQTPVNSYPFITVGSNENDDCADDISIIKDLLSDNNEFNNEIANENEINKDYNNQRHFFTKNEGQIENDEIYFNYEIPGRGIAFMESAILFKLEKASDIQEESIYIEETNEQTEGYLLKLEFKGSNKVIPEGVGSLQHWNNYFYGNNPDKWRSNVPNYKEIIYYELYNGIDLKYYFTKEHGLKYDFIVQPQADPSNIKMKYEGADKIEIDANGNLIIKTDNEYIMEQKPYIYQENVVISGQFLLREDKVITYNIDDYDSTLKLIIDPSLQYSTFIGGSSYDLSYGIAVDSVGDVYITGQTNSSDVGNSSAFPTTPDAYNRSYSGDWEVFLSKLSTNGNGNLDLIYSTYLGGSDSDIGRGIAVDSNGNVYVSGSTHSTDFPTTFGAYDESKNGGADVFVTKLNPTGTELIYSTLIGGSEIDSCMDIAIDLNNNAYITGTTTSTDYPITNGSYDETHNDVSIYHRDIFITKLNRDGSDLIYSTYIGGNKSEFGPSIAVDSSGNAYISGYTNSDGDGGNPYPTTFGAYNESLCGNTDIFISKLNINGSSLLYSTFIGGIKNDDASGIAVDTSGNIYICGDTWSNDFPNTTGSYDESYNGNQDVCVCKLNPAGNGKSDLLYSTFIGGEGQDIANSIAVDKEGIIYITGLTFSNDSYPYPTTVGAFDRTINHYIDAVLTKLNPKGNGNYDLLYSTLIGGNGINEEGKDIIVDSKGNAYIIGDTKSTDFPTTSGAFDVTHNNYTDVFLCKFIFPDIQPNGGLHYSSYIGGTAHDQGKAIATDNQGNVYVTGFTASKSDVGYSKKFPTTPGAYNTEHNSGGSDVFVCKFNLRETGASSLVWSTFIGGSGGYGGGWTDYGEDIAVDSTGNVYITGYTTSQGGENETQYPTTSGAFDETHNGNNDVFVTKLNPTGSGLIYSTLIGGSGDDQVYSIELDYDGNVYITGMTLNHTTNYPVTPDAYDTVFGGGRDAFITKVNATGSGLIYSTYLGGMDIDRGHGIAIDVNCNAYITGETYSHDFPLKNEFQDIFAYAYVSKLNSNGTDLLYSTYLGDRTSGNEITVDYDGNAYVTGKTKSDFSTTDGAYQTSYGGGESDVFVTKFTPGGSNLCYSTFLGGVGNDEGQDIAIDNKGNVYITGKTSHDPYGVNDFPTSDHCLDSSFNGGETDVFVSKINADGIILEYSTYMGGSTGFGDEGYGIAVDEEGYVYVTGWTYDWLSEFPVVNAYSYEPIGSDDVFVSKFKMTDWISLGTEQLNSTTSSVNISSTSGKNKLYYFMDEYYIYFKLYTELSPDINDYTYAVLLDEEGNGTYDYCISTYGETDSIKIYKWNYSSNWDNDNVLIRDVEDFYFDTINNTVQFALAFVDTFKIRTGYNIYAVTYDEENNTFEDNELDPGDWEAINNPIPIESEGDYTEPVEIPDNEKPKISNIQVNPTNQIRYGWVNITCNVTDNVGVKNVIVNITNPIGQQFNETMTQINNSSIYYFNSTYSIVGTYQFFIRAEDVNNNWDISSLYSFEINSTMTFISSLFTGWNLVGIPFSQSVSLDDIIVSYEGVNYSWENATTNNNPTGAPIVLKFVYGWNRTAQQYELVEGLDPGYGYWMYSYYNCTFWVNLSGMKKNDYEITSLLVGWDLVGLPVNKTISLNNIIVKYDGIEYSWENATTSNNPTGGPIVLKFVYGWNRTNQQYDLVDELNPGYGYWMYAYYNCTLSRQIKTTTSQTMNKKQILPVDFIWEPIPQKSCTKIQFEASITSPPNKIGETKSSQYNIIKWLWSFDNLRTSNEQNLSFTFTNPGTYQVTLTVWNEEGISDSITYNIKILGNETNQSFTPIKYAQASKYSDSTIGNRQVAQSFITTTSNLESISLYLSSKYNTPKTAIIEIRPNTIDQWDRDIPSDIVIASTQILFSEIPSNPTWINFEIEASLNLGEKYWIVLFDDATERTTTYILWWQKYEWTGNGETYLEGEKAYSENGIDWYPNKSGDRLFKINAYIIKNDVNSKSEQIYNQTVNHSNIDIEIENTLLELIKEDTKIDKNIIEKVKSSLIDDTESIDEENEELQNNENEENTIYKKKEKEYFNDLISKIESSIVISIMLIFIFIIRKKKKKH